MIPSTFSSPKDSKPRDVFQTAGTAGSILNSEPLDGSNRGMYITVLISKWKLERLQTISSLCLLLCAELTFIHFLLLKTDMSTERTLSD